jgi:cholesterol transport system auxiliary component
MTSPTLARLRLTPLRIVGVGLMALSLAGCVSLLPKQKPSQLYRFEGAPPAAASEAEPKTETAGGPRIGVFRAGGQFQREAAGDRILTIAGDKTAYIADARWVAPADVLFEQSLARAFDGAGKARLVVRGEPARASWALRLDVRNFEARYAGHRPSVVVRVRASLLRDSSQGVQEKIFEATVPAGDNRVGAIVAAYDRAVGQVLAELVTWVEASVS